MNLLITIKDLTSAMKTVAFIVLLCLLLGLSLQVVELRKNSDSNLKNHSPTWLWEKREETVTTGASLKQTGKTPNHKRKFNRDLRHEDVYPPNFPRPGKREFTSKQSSTIGNLFAKRAQR